MRSILAISLICALCTVYHDTFAQPSGGGPGVPAQIIYVKKGATGSANGTSWTNAYPELRTALTAAQSISGTKQIWVAQGEYKPTANIDRSVSFVLLASTSLYGGFLGNETSLSARNWKSNRTVLSGDLGRLFDKTDNSHHVVVAADVDHNSILDGFIIKEGNAQDSISLGGGILLISTTGLTSPKIRNCSFVNNSASGGGGLGTKGEGGGQFSPEIVNCTFDGNSALIGGAILITGLSDENDFPKFINCTINSNSATVGGGGAIFSPASLINCTITYNKSDSDGSAIYNAGKVVVKNSIVWKNFTGSIGSPNYADQIINSGPNALPVIKNNIIQGGYGPDSVNNIDVDPLFINEPSFVGKYPRTSVISTQSTDPKYENQLQLSGASMPSWWTYYTFKDHAYNKLYITGVSLQVIDFNNLTNGLPTSTVNSAFYFGRISRIEKAVHNAGNKIYLQSGQSGLKSVDRATGATTLIPLLAGEPITYSFYKAEDIFVDNDNDLLYAPIFYSPGNVFYGLVEWNPLTNAKRWITTTSSPVSVPPVYNGGDGAYWNGHRLYMDEVSNTLYYSMGNGVWWWNRNNNSTGVYNTAGGIPLAPGNPNLPSNLATSMYIDHSQNKFYIGTHSGLFVWDRNNNTSRVYNTSNSKMIHNLVNHVDISNEENLVFVACEYGGLFTINKSTGEEKLYVKDSGNEIYPQLIDKDISSANFDDVDKKLYVSSYYSNGGVWVKDYNNLVPDYGDLRLKPGSPAIDRGDNNFLPGAITLDIDGLERRVDYTNLFGTNSLDLGAFEKVYVAEDEPAPVISDSLAQNYVLVYNASVDGIKDESTLDNYPVKDVNKSIEYIDGLGRPIQSIAIQGSPSRLDIVQPIVYDAYGREALKYLPYVDGNTGLYRSNPVGTDGNYANSPHQNFYDNPNSVIVQDGAPFAKTVFEASPLNRVLKQGAPGQDWQPSENTAPDRTIRKEYLTNAAQEVMLFSYDPGTGTISASNNGQRTYYNANELFANKTIDEHYNEVIEYSDKEGKVILKNVQFKTEGTTKLYASTYYIYDDFGNLVVVLPPEGVNNFLSLTNQN